MVANITYWNYSIFGESGDFLIMPIYRKTSEILADFRRYCAERVASGIYVTDCERILADRFHASRGALRKAMSAAEAEGIIRRNGRKTEITISRGTLAGCGKIIFVSPGYMDVYSENAMSRLGRILADRVAREGGTMEKFLLNEKTSLKMYTNALAEANVILVAGSTCKNPALLHEVFSRIPENKIFLRFSGSADHSEEFLRNQIVLDNYLVGVWAAEMLSIAGSKRPVAVWRACVNDAFRLRAQGFSDALRRMGIGGAESVHWVEPGHFMAVKAAARLEWALKAGFDGVFVMSDENISDVSSGFFDSQTGRWSVPLITVNGSLDCMRNSSPVAALGHASERVASYVIDSLHDIAAGRFTGVKTLVKPTFHFTESLDLETNHFKYKKYEINN